MQLQMSVTEDESDDEEDGEVVGKEPPKTQKDKYSTIYDEIKVIQMSLSVF